MIGVLTDLSPKGLVEWLEDREQRRTGNALPIVRRRVADRVRMAPGTLENVVRERLKRGLDLIRDRLLAIVIEELRAEVTRNLHEIEVLKGCSRALGEQQMGEVLQSLQKSDAILRAYGKGDLQP